MVHPAAYLNDIPRPFWIAAMVLAFVWHWPIGLALLAYMIGSGRLRHPWACGPGRWYNTAPADGQARPWGKWGQPTAPQSGNAAFDEYRAQTLRRLEEEQREFVEYLERLRQAKDKAEFDQFMADRRRPPMDPAAN